jgi:hypothetical protein
VDPAALVGLWQVVAQGHAWQLQVRPLGGLLVVLVV